MDRAAQLFKNEPIIGLESNRPFLLNKPGWGWYIHEGRIDVFSVRIGLGIATGARTHYFTSEKGEILLSIPFVEQEAELHFLAVATPNTSIVEFRLSHLTKPDTDDNDQLIIISLVEKWISQLANGLSFGDIENSGQNTVRGLNQSFRANSYIYARKQLLWIEITEGDALLLGLNEVRKEGVTTLIPIVGELYLQPLNDVTGNCYLTDEVIKKPFYWDSLDHFYNLLLLCLEYKNKLARVDELNLLNEKSGYNQLSQSDTLFRIASVVNTQISKNHVGSREDPMLAACRLVAQNRGIQVKKPVKPRTSELQPMTLNDVLHASRFRARKVKLEEDWWTKDTGSLLAFTVIGQNPVALVQKGPGRIVYIEPGTGIRKPMSPDLSRLIQPFAYQFYPPLPNKVITGRELVSFGIKNCRHEIIYISILALVGGMLNLIIPLVTGLVFDQVIPQSNFRLLGVFATILVLTAISLSIFQLIRNLSMIRIETKMDFILQSAIWDRVLNLPIPFFRKFTSGELSLKTNSILMVRKAMSDTVVFALLGSVTLIFNLIFLFWFNLILGMITVGILFATMFFAGLLGMRMKKLQTKQIGYQNKLYGIVTQLLTSITKIKTTGSEIHAFEQWANRFASQKSESIALRKLNIVAQQLLTFVPVLILIFVFLYIHLFVSQKMSTGEFMTFFTALTITVVGCMSASAAIISFFLVIPLFDNVKPILEALPENFQAKPASATLQGEIDIANLSFRYHEKLPLVLKNVSIHVNPGEFVAIVGPSGSGKSTLLRLLLGFEAPETGTICYDRHDLSMVDAESIRRQVGTVLQTSQLSPGTIYSNIAGMTDTTLDDVYEVACMASLGEEIELMPMGMFTSISEGISTLSGGQRQRILIARALVTRPRILFLDEATSALDNKTQQVVGKSLEGLNASRVVIAHRLSTVINADQIFVMENGEIVESGTYAQLQDQGGKFAELVRRQMIE
jgi:NHLM bacteriocin system ABC transporter ATP-binding protein